MPLLLMEQLRKESSNGNYLYLLVVKKENGNDEKLWLNIEQLSKRPEAAVARKTISVRLSKFFNHGNTKRKDIFCNIMDCISTPPMTKNRNKTQGRGIQNHSLGNFNEALELMVIK